MQYIYLELLFSIPNIQNNNLYPICKRGLFYNNIKNYFLSSFFIQLIQEFCPCISQFISQGGGIDFNK